MSDFDDHEPHQRPLYELDLPDPESTSRIAEFDPTPYLRKIGGRGRSGEDYLDVKHRLLWLRTEHPDAQIVTEHIQIDGQSAIFKATVTIPGGGTASGHGSETAGDFPDYIEKAETKALGRALNALGYGAQFADSEERREPQQRVTAAPTPKTPSSASEASSDYSWSAFWRWAREEGIDDKAALEQILGESMEPYNPRDLRVKLADKMRRHS